MLNVYLNHTKLGFGQLVVLGKNHILEKVPEDSPVVGHVSQLVAWIIQAPAPPFPLFVASYFLAGFGFAIQVMPTIIVPLERRRSTP